MGNMRKKNANSIRCKCNDWGSRADKFKQTRNENKQQCEGEELKSGRHARDRKRDRER